MLHFWLTFHVIDVVLAKNILDSIAFLDMRIITE